MDDVKSLLPFVLLLIVVVGFMAFAASMATEEVVQSVLNQVPMH